MTLQATWNANTQYPDDIKIQSAPISTHNTRLSHKALKGSIHSVIHVKRKMKRKYTECGQTTQTKHSHFIHNIAKHRIGVATKWKEEKKKNANNKQNKKKMKRKAKMEWPLEPKNVIRNCNKNSKRFFFYFLLRRAKSNIALVCWRAAGLESCSEWLYSFFYLLWFSLFISWQYNIFLRLVLGWHQHKIGIELVNSTNNEW